MKPFSIIVPRAWNDANPDAPEIWPLDYGVHPDHCREVLAGSYDCPYWPKTPPVCLDIGSNIGAFARWASERWRGATIHCYEPNPENFARLERTVMRLKSDQWAGASDNASFTLHNVAVGGHACRAQLFAGAYNCGEHSLLMDAGKGSVEVEVISALDLPKANVLKIDVEGSEAAILATLYSAGRMGEFDCVMMECHNPTWVRPITVRMAEAGFSLTGHTTPYPNRDELKFVKTALIPDSFQIPKS